MVDYEPSRKNLRQPRKTNTRALALIEAGDPLWDKRAVDRAANRHRLRQQERDAARPLSLAATHRDRVLELAPGWSCAGGTWRGEGLAKLVEALVATAAMVDPQRRLVRLEVTLAGYSLVEARRTLREQAPEADYHLVGEVEALSTHRPAGAGRGRAPEKHQGGPTMPICPNCSDVEMVADGDQRVCPDCGYHEDN